MQTTFFIKNKDSVIRLLSIFEFMNKSKCKIAGKGTLKGIKVALCELKCEKKFRSHITKI